MPIDYFLPQVSYSTAALFYHFKIGNENNICNGMLHLFGNLVHTDQLAYRDLQGNWVEVRCHEDGSL